MPKQRKILMIEDMPDQRMLIMTVFRTAGADYDFEELPDGTAAMDWIHAHPDGGGADLIMLDHRMPGYSGLEVLQELRKKDKITPVIFMTAENSAQLTVEAMRLGITDFIIKEGAFQMLLPEVARRVLEKVDIQQRLDDAESATQFQSAKMANLGQILCEVLHELKTPLTALGSSLAELKQAPTPDRPSLLADSLGSMTRNAERSKQIVLQLLDFASQKTYSFQKNDVPAMLTGLLDGLRSRCERQKITVKFDKPARFPSVKLDAKMIKPAIYSLLLNAVEAMPDGGVLTVQTRDLPKEDAVEIEVSDTGVGIPEKDQIRLFESHYTTKSTGTGLGLLLAHQAIYQHRGTIRFKSAEGSGSTFTIRLPLDPPTR